MISRKRRYRKKNSWCRTSDIKLIEFIKKREYIWNLTSINYNDKTLKIKAFAEFAENLDGNFTAQLVKERWMNIRTTFSSNLRKVQLSQQSAESRDLTYVPTWYLWKACQFLKLIRMESSLSDKTEPLGILESNIKQEIQDENDLDCYDDNGDDPDYVPEQNEDVLLSKKFKIDYKPKSSKSELFNFPPALNGAINQMKPLKECDKILGDLLKILEPLQKMSSVKDESASKSDFDYIGCHVTERLSKMRPFDAECASKRIMDILLLYSDVNPNNPNKLS